MKFLLNTALSLTLAFSATSALAACDEGEIVIKFAHVTNTDRHPTVAPRIAKLQAKGRRRAEAEHGVTVDRLTEMYLEIYESSETRPAGKMQAIIGLAKLHGLM